MVLEAIKACSAYVDGRRADTGRNTHALFKPHFTITHWQKQVKVRVKSTAKSSVQCQIQRGVKIQNHTMSHSATQGVTRSVLLSCRKPESMKFPSRESST